MSLCDGRDHLPGSQIAGNLKCARCGADLGPYVPPLEPPDERPTGQNSPFLGEAIHASQANADGYQDQIELRLQAGEAEYGRMQFLVADCDREALEESMDIGGWLLLADCKLEREIDAGRISPVDAARVRHLRLTATAHAVRAYAAITLAREIQGL